MSATSLFDHHMVKPLRASALETLLSDAPPRPLGRPGEAV